MNRGIHGSVFAASLFISGLAFAQAAAPAAGTATAPPAPAQTKPDAGAPKPEVTPQQQKIADLIKQLGSPDFPTRDAASNELLKLGPEALPALKEALKSEDPSIQSYAEFLVPKIEGARDPRDGRRVRVIGRNGAGQQFGIVGNRAGAAAGAAGAADVLIARPGRIAINVTANNNQRTTNITDGDRQVKIEEGLDGIHMSVTDNDGGKLVTKDYEAKSIDEMRKEQPDAAQIYDKYMGRVRGGALNRNGAVLRLAPPALDDNGLNVNVRRQIEDVQKLQDMAIQQQLQQQDRIRDLVDKQNLNAGDQQLEVMHRRLQAETEMLERRLAEVEAMRKQLLEQTQAAQKRLAELEKQQQEKQEQKKEPRP
jgi:hypothetical protein